MESILPVIMAGGYGTRLWPLSRQLNPKQFLKLHGDYTMLQSTIKRLDGVAHQSPCIICNEEHRFLVAEQLRQLSLEGSAILLEPEGRNTAPAIALAALQALQKNEDPLLLVLAADHLIKNTQNFHESIRAAASIAETGKLVTFGIVPTSPETGYGYIQRGDELGAGQHGYAVANFVEKPDLKTAEGYVASGNFFWNSGMFMFRASVYLEALGKFQPAMLKACQVAMEKSTQDLDFIRVDRDAFLSCPNESIDYAIMEKTDRAAMVPMDAAWSDIGSWSALWEVSDKTVDGNALTGDVMAIDTQNCLVHSSSRLVATVGLQDLVIVETKDAVLVAHKDKVQSVKDVVTLIKEQDRSEYVSHREVYRPWGMYDSIDQGQRYQVKRISVKPGGKLSVQMHHHRAEHWVVVSGTAKVFNKDKTYFVTENESTFIPIGQVHSLENPGKVPLELIEVQSGSYLGEDDIVRFEDKYGR